MLAQKHPLNISLESSLNKLSFGVKSKGIGRTTTKVWWEIISHE